MLNMGGYRMLARYSPLRPSPSPPEMFAFSTTSRKTSERHDTMEMIERLHRFVQCNAIRPVKGSYWIPVEFTHRARFYSVMFPKSYERMVERGEAIVRRRKEGASE